MDDLTVVALAGQVIVGAASAWAGAHKGVADLGAKVTGLTERVGQLEVVVGLRGALRGALRGKHVRPPAPNYVDALIQAEGGPRAVDDDKTPADGIVPDHKEVTK